MRLPRYLRNGLAVLLGLLMLAGCTARTDVAATGAAPGEAVHLWVTVQEIGFASAADTPADSATGWTREKLSAPVVLDLANVDGGALVPIVSGMRLPAGRYRQLHLAVADPDDSLVDEARAAGLQYNAQIELRDDAGGITKAPLEMPVPRAGLTVPIDFSLEYTGRSADDGGEVQDFAVTLDASRGVLSYEFGDRKGYILSPVVSVQESAAAGEIRGSVDVGALAGDHPPVTVSAQRLDDGASHRVVVQRRSVASDGTFALHPLPTGDGRTSYDVVITCAAAGTVVVRDVPVVAGEAPVTLQSEPIALVPADSVHADVDGASAGLPAGTRVDFYQTLPGRDEQPFLVDSTVLDLLTRRLPGEAFALGGGALLVGSYADGDAIAFGAETPSERDGGYVVGSGGPYRADTLAAAPVVVTGSSSRATLVTVPYPEFAAPGRAGRLALNLSAPVGRYDRGFVTVMAGGRVVETTSVDQLLERGGGTVIVDGLPSGGALAPVAGVSYRAALRAWNSRNAAGTIRRVAASGSASLGDQGSGALRIEVR